MVFKTNYRLLQAMLRGEHSAILLTFNKLPFVIMIFVLSIFEWQCYTCFTVLLLKIHNMFWFINKKLIYDFEANTFPGNMASLRFPG